MVTAPTLAAQTSRPAPSITTAIRRALSFPVLLGAILVAASFSLAGNTFRDPDMWWHMAVGQHILATHTLPWSDTYSSTVAGAPWIAYEWLGEVAIAAAASISGLLAAAFLLASLSAVLAVLLYYYATLKCAETKAAFAACAILMPVLGAFFTLRPQLFGAIFLVTTLIVVEKFSQGSSRALWLLPPLFLIWVNTHGSFVFGFLVLGAAWLCGQFEFSAGSVVAERWSKRQSVQLLVAILASTLILPLTPYGTRLAAYPLSMALSQPLNTSSIREWLPLGTEGFIGKYVVVLLLLFFLASLTERPRFRVFDLAMAMFAELTACLHIRFVLLLLIFLAPLFAQVLARWVPPYSAEQDRPAFNAVLIALLAAGSLFLFPSRRSLNQQVDAQYPRSALQYLAAHPIRGTLLNDYGWGGYLIWATPRTKVFIDGRADVYEYAGVLQDYINLADLKPESLQIFEKYNIQACLIRRDAALGAVLATMPGWERVYVDPLAAIFVKKHDWQTH